MSETRDPEFLAISDASVFEEARDRMDISLEHDSKNRSEGKEAMLFREGENHWDDEVVTSSSMETPELVINFTDTLVTRTVNNIAEREPRGKCHPVGDGADIDRAEVIQGIGRHIEYRSEASVAYDTGVDNAVTMGWGWWEMLSEFETPQSFNKEIRISPIMNVFSVYGDPAAIMPTACDMNWCLIAIDLQRTEFKRLYPKADNAAFNDAGRSDAHGWEEKETIRIAKYYRIREKTANLLELTDGEGKTYNIWESELPDAQEMAQEKLQITNRRESSRRQVEMFRLNGTKVIEREILPGSWIPVIRCQGNARNIDGRIYRRGMVKSMMDPQRMVDYGEVAKIRRLGLSPQAPWVAAEGQIDSHPEWSDTNVVAHPVLTYKPVTVQTAQGEQVLPPPQRQPPAQIEAGFAEFVQGMRSNLLAIAGMPNEPGQDEQQGQTVSGIALQRRDKLSDQSHSQYYKNQKLAIAHTWRIMLEWIPHYYSEARMQRIIGEDGKPQMVKLNDPGIDSVKNDVTTGRYDVVMDAGPSYETKREEGAANMIQLMSIPELAEIVAKRGADLVFRAIDAPYMEELADRIAGETPEGLEKILESLPRQAQAIVKAMAGQITQLQQALQQSQQDLKLGLTKTHMETTVKAHDIEEDNKTKRADTQSRERTALHLEAMKGHVTLAKEEIAVTGKLLDTHAQAGHDARAAERMIEAGESAEKGNGSA